MKIVYISKKKLKNKYLQIIFIYLFTSYNKYMLIIY